MSQQIPRNFNSQWLQKIYQHQVKSNASTIFDCDRVMIDNDTNVTTLILLDDLNTQDDANEVRKAFFYYIADLMKTRTVGISYSLPETPTGSYSYIVQFFYQIFFNTSNHRFSIFSPTAEYTLEVIEYNEKYALSLISH